jgi:hypothetical protein
MKTPLQVTPGDRPSTQRVRLLQSRAWFAAASVSGNEGCSIICAALIVLLLSSLSAAQTLSGAVKNSTTGKPSAGDEVILFRLGAGMEEAGRTHTDGEGRFSFKLDDPQALHLVRTVHQGVSYHRVVLPGSVSLAVDVSDVAKAVEGVQVLVDIMRIETAQGHIVVTRDFGVRNSSNPPRTQMNDRNLEFYVPEGAKIIADSATATSESGNPLKSAPVPESEKNRYSFVYPLRPGFTHFEVAYQLPYSGNANLDPKPVYSLQNFVVIVPKAMQFRATAASADFKLMSNAKQPDATVLVAANTKAGQNLAFSISGAGALRSASQKNAEPSQQSTENSVTGAPPAVSEKRPGGGLGRPINAPDPLQKYRWWILGGTTAVLLLGIVYVSSRRQFATRAVALQNRSSSSLQSVEAGVRPTKQPALPRPSSSQMAIIKEELFKIELERKRGQISQSDYEKAKSALDRNLVRALKREVRKA